MNNQITNFAQDWLNRMLSHTRKKKLQLQLHRKSYTKTTRQLQSVLSLLFNLAWYCGISRVTALFFSAIFKDKFKKYHSQKFNTFFKKRNFLNPSSLILLLEQSNTSSPFSSRQINQHIRNNLICLMNIGKEHFYIFLKFFGLPEIVIARIANYLK